MKLNRYLLPFFAVLFGALSATAQITLPDDTVLCPNEPQALLAGFRSVPNPTVLTLSDDQFSPAITIGFPFTFYGNTYTQLVISSNNYITFDVSAAGGYSGWNITANIPNAGNAQPNSIMCPWQDVHPGIGGTVAYGISGVAPNRVFTVSFCEVPMFSCTSLMFTSQILLFENGNRIETHIENKPLCTTWNGGVAIHGTQNSTGTIADVVPGRNFSDPVWTTSQEGMSFMPNGAGYTISPVPYKPSVFGPINWYYANNNQLYTTGDSITISLPPGTVETLYAETSICGGTVLRDTVTVYMPFINGVELQPACPNPQNGELYIDVLDQNPYFYNVFLIDANDSIVYANSPVTIGDTAKGLAAGTYVIAIVDENGCEIRDTVTVGALPAVVAGIAPLADTLVDTATVYWQNLSSGATSYYWDLGNGTTSGDMYPITYYDTCGTYTVQLRAENSQGCMDTTFYQFEILCPQDPTIPVVLEIPNVFTPNGDGTNDYFNVNLSSGTFAEFRGQIFNRWGVEVYAWNEGQTKDAGWDGKIDGTEAAAGAYFYIIFYKQQDGQSKVEKGTLTLFR